MVCDQMWVNWYGKNFFLNGQEVYFYAMLVAASLYVLFSRYGKRTHFDLDKMLHRGVYRVASERVNIDADDSAGVNNREVKHQDGFWYYRRVHTG